MTTTILDRIKAYKLEEVAAAKRDAAAADRAALLEFAPWLARSDHRPIRAIVTVACADGGQRWVTVGSHNVQEHVRDGLATYIGALPFVSSGGSARQSTARLMRAMLSEEVRAQQRADVCAVVDRELSGGADAY